MEPSLRLAWLQLACAPTVLDAGTAETRERAEAVIAATGVEGDALQTRLVGMRIQMALAELANHLDEMASAVADDPHTRLALWQRFAEAYPYFDGGLYEQAVALDQLQQPEASLALLRDAILINPVDPMRWQSLGVVVKRLGWADESLVCLFVAQQLAGAVSNQSKVVEPTDQGPSTPAG